MARLFTVLRNNWKKTTFITLVGNYGAYRLYNYIGDLQIMKQNCLKAQELGDQPLRGQLRHVTVILNPVSGKRKAKKYYTKFVEPLLHLAGLKVSLIETESPGQAKEIMQIMSNCDCVAVVGGDGTVNEVLNGLLSRPDAASASKAYPIAIIPVGKKNTIAGHIHQDLPQRNFKELLISSTMSLVYNNARKFDVLTMKPMANINDDVHYCLKGLKYGVYQEISTEESTYMPLYIQQYWYKIIRIIRPDKYTYPKIDGLEVSQPCYGCSKCYESHQITDKEIVENKNIPAKRWWTSLIPISTKSTQTEEERSNLLLSKRVNDGCNTWTDLKVTNISNIEATSIGHSSIKLSIHRDDDYLPSEDIEAQNIRLHVRCDHPNEEDTLVTQNVNEQDSGESTKEDKRPKFIVDGEPSFCRPVELSTLKNVTIFTELGITKSALTFQ